MQTIEKNESDYTQALLKDYLDTLSTFLALKNIEILTYTQASLNHFSTLSTSKQNSILENVKIYLNIVNKHGTRTNLTKEDEVKCIKEALNEYGLKTKDDDFDFIDENDIVEIYNEHNIQIYRNFQFLKVNPYDLLTILTIDWPNLYERSHLITEEITHKINTVMSSDITSHTSFLIPEHTMKAVAKDDKVVVSIKLKNIKPVFNNSLTKKVAFIATQYNSPILLEGTETSSLLILKQKNK